MPIYYSVNYSILGDNLKAGSFSDVLSSLYRTEQVFPKQIADKSTGEKMLVSRNNGERL